jgi:glycosyltransferase involved in cell wall biosynthesis
MTTVPPEAGGGIANLHRVIAEHDDCLDLLFCQSASRSPLNEPVPKRVLRVFDYSFRVAALLIKHPSIEVVHINTAPDNKAVLRDSLLIAVARTFGRKVVVQIHGGINDYGRHVLVNALAKNALQKCGAVLVFTMKDKKIIDSMNCIESKILPNAVVVRDFEPTKDKPPVTAKEPVILFMSRFLAEKGVYELINAIECIVGASEPARFVLAGDGPERQGMEAECKKRGIGKSVVFTGYLGYQDVVRAYKSADIFVLPSYSEAMPMTILQALAAGLPIVSTRSGAIPEIVTEGVSGFLVDPKNAAQLADRITALLRDASLRREMGKVNLQLAWKYYDISVLINQLKQLYMAL